MAKRTFNSKTTCSLAAATNSDLQILTPRICRICGFRFAINFAPAKARGTSVGEKQKLIFIFIFYMFGLKKNILKKLKN